MLLLLIVAKQNLFKGHQRSIIKNHHDNKLSNSSVFYNHHQNKTLDHSSTSMSMFCKSLWIRQHLDKRKYNFAKLYLFFQSRGDCQRTFLVVFRNVTVEQCRGANANGNGTSFKKLDTQNKYLKATKNLSLCVIVVADVFVLCTETEAVDFGW